MQLCYNYLRSYRHKTCWVIRWRPDRYDIGARLSSGAFSVQQSLGHKPISRRPAPGDKCFVLTTNSGTHKGQFVAHGCITSPPGLQSSLDAFCQGHRRHATEESVQLHLQPCQDLVDLEVRRKLACACRRSFNLVSQDVARLLQEALCA